MGSQEPRNVRYNRIVTNTTVADCFLLIERERAYNEPNKAQNKGPLFFGHGPVVK
jgi:hypothetical protein